MTLRLAFFAEATPVNGGTFNYTVSMLQAVMAMEDVDLMIFTRSDNPHYDAFGPPVVRLPALSSRLTGSILEFIGWGVGDPFGNHDLVLAPIRAPILLHTNTPFVFTLHDVQELHLPDNFSVFQRFWRHQLQSRTSRKAAMVLCESSGVKQDIHVAYGIGRGRIEVIKSPPVIVPDILLSGDRMAEARRRYDLRGKYLYYPAQYWPHKNHLRLIEAFKIVAGRHPDVALVFSGRQNAGFAKVSAHASNTGLGRRIRFLGYVDQDFVPSVYRLSLGLVMPSLFESISIPVYEAQQLGVPVCASAISGVIDQVGNSGLLFDPKQVPDIARSMDVLLSDESRRVELGAVGRVRFHAAQQPPFPDRLRRLIDKAIATVPGREGA